VEGKGWEKMGREGMGKGGIERRNLRKG